MLFLFISLCSLLVASAVNIIIHLNGSIKGLMKSAKTSHFMQMHSGTVNQERLEQFVNDTAGIEVGQDSLLLNIEGINLWIGDNSLSESMQDNAFVIQNEKFDYLLDDKNTIIHPREREIYVPIYYWTAYRIQIGDIFTVRNEDFEKKFTVAGYLRDSQMNAAVASSKRFLIHEDDWNILVLHLGKIEHMIEFRLENEKEINKFATLYSNHNLEANGPTLTYQMFAFLNVLDDCIMAAIIIMVSLLCVCISFLSIRFTLLTTLEEEYREIGILKAIGLQNRSIQKIYLGKYRILVIAGSVAGYVSSFFLNTIILQNMRLYMGGESKVITSIFAGAMGSGLIILVLLIFIKGVLKRLEMVSPIQAIRFGGNQQESKTLMIRLSCVAKIPVNVLLGFKDICNRCRLFIILFVIFMMAAFMITVPMNLYTTMSSEQFITYLGVGKCDIRMDVQQTENIKQKVDVLCKKLKGDKSIEKYSLFVTTTAQIKTTDGIYENIKIESGNHTVFPLNYIDGSAPEKSDQIALSVLNANEFNKEVGDTVTVVINGKETELTVCGIYQDVTNGGKTAKTVVQCSDEIMWYVICMNVNTSADISYVIDQYKDTFPYAKINSVQSYVWKTMGGSIARIRTAAIIAIVIAVAVSVFITILFMNMIIAHDRSQIAIMKAIGFQYRHIRMQYLTKTITILVMGIVCGCLLANTIGMKLTAIFLSEMGIQRFRFISQPWLVYGIYPTVLLLFVVLAATVSMKKIQLINIMENIQE